MSLTTITSEERARRLGLFDHQGQDEHYEELHLDGIWWVKAWDGRSERWRVSRYSEESYARYKNYSN